MKIFVVSYENPDWARDYSFVHESPTSIKAFCDKENAEQFINELVKTLREERYFVDGEHTVFDRNNYEITEVELVE